MDRKDYFNEASQWCRWNPSDNQENYTIELNESKFRHVVKRFLRNEHETSYFDIQDRFGDTVYKALAFEHMPLINQVALLTGRISPSEFADLYNKDKDPRGKFPYWTDDGTEFVDGIEEMTRELWEEGMNVKEGGKEEPPAFKLVPIDSGQAALKGIDALLDQTGNPNFGSIYDFYKGVDDTLEDLKRNLKDSTSSLSSLKKDYEAVQEELKVLQVRQMSSFENVELEGDGTIPEGTITTKKASEVFPDIKLDTDYELPFFEWDGPHPDVPEVDPHYIFRSQQLNRVLLSLATNSRAYLYGHTGSGKTTLIEQVAAHLNWPFARINFDSEITRMDLIGRDTLTYEEGEQISKFVDGILPKVMAGPYLCCFDELDFARPDVAYVMQAALEGKPLRITEDGDRIVKPHSMFRMFGTGNTVGQGDEDGMYQGARVQSLAFMNRFSYFVHVPYMTEKEMSTLVKREFPSLKKDHHNKLMQYFKEHFRAFDDGKVLAPVSPRGVLSVARATIITDNFADALSAVFIDAANQEDRAVLKGIVDRVT